MTDLLEILGKMSENLHQTLLLEYGDWQHYLLTDVLSTPFSETLMEMMLNSLF